MLKSQDIRDERNLECPPEKPETTHIISSSPYQGTRRHDVFVNHAHGSFHLLAESSRGLTSSLVPFSEPRLLSSLLQSKAVGTLDTVSGAASLRDSLPAGSAPPD